MAALPSIHEIIQTRETRVDEIAMENRLQAITDRLTQGLNPQINFKTMIDDGGYLRPLMDINASSFLYENSCYINISTRLWNSTESLVRKESDDELAAILGHEITHCLFWHKQRTFTETIIFGNWEDESRADFLSMVYMARGGYKPEAAVEIWRRRAAQGSRVEEFMGRSYPSSDQRSQYLQASLTRAKDQAKLLDADVGVNLSVPPAPPRPFLRSEYLHIPLFGMVWKLTKPPPIVARGSGTLGLIYGALEGYTKNRFLYQEGRRSLIHAVADGVGCATIAAVSGALGGYAGSLLIGSKIGASLGSVVPGLGTFAGFLVGGVVGLIIGGALTTLKDHAVRPRSGTSHF